MSSREVLDLCDSDDDEEIVVAASSNNNISAAASPVANKSNIVDDAASAISKKRTAPPATAAVDAKKAKPSDAADAKSTEAETAAAAATAAASTRAAAAAAPKGAAKFGVNSDSSLKRIAKELKEMTAAPPAGCTAAPKNNDLNEWTATIDGPSNSPYAGGKFFLNIKFGASYPFKPPSIQFETKIFHCNIAEGGTICLDILQSNWSPALTIQKVLLSLSSLLTDPNADSPLNPKAATVYKRSKAEHDKIAADYTKKFAGKNQ